jgi:DNA-binding GntR family transcriptional regulator
MRIDYDNEDFCYQLDEIYLVDNHKEIMSQIVNNDFQLIDAEIQCHFHKGFAKILKKDSQYFKHDYSFDLKENIDQILKSG